MRQLLRVIDATHMCQFLSGSGAAYVASYVSISHRGASRRLCSPYVSIFILNIICVNFSAGNSRDAYASNPQKADGILKIIIKFLTKNKNRYNFVYYEKLK